MSLVPSSTDPDPLELGEIERLAAAAAPARLRPAYRAVFALDGALRRIALSAREPLPAQLGLAWWRDACGDIRSNRSRHPVLLALDQDWHGDAGHLISLVDAWEEVAVSQDARDTAAEALASCRARAFAAIAQEGESAALGAARVWTLVTLAEHAPDAQQREAMRATARGIAAQRLPRSLRPLAVLAGLARRALAANRGQLIGDRLSPLAAMRLGIFGR